MEKTKETEFFIKKNDNEKKVFSLLLPYYTTDKCINKLKNKVLTLAQAYKDFYKKIEQENNPFYKKFINKKKHQFYIYNKTARNFINHNKLFSNQNILAKTAINFTNYRINTHTINTNENINYHKIKILNEILPPVTNYNPNHENLIFDGSN